MVLVQQVLKQLMEWGVFRVEKGMFLQVHFTFGDPPMAFIIESRIVVDMDTTNHIPGCGIPIEVLSLSTRTPGTLQSFSELPEELDLIANRSCILDIKFCLLPLDIEE